MPEDPVEPCAQNSRETEVDVNKAEPTPDKPPNALASDNSTADTAKLESEESTKQNSDSSKNLDKNTNETEGKSEDVNSTEEKMVEKDAPNPSEKEDAQDSKPMPGIYVRR
jgi:hypothetical protein